MAGRIEIANEAASGLDFLVRRDDLDVERVYMNLLDGRAEPDAGHILSL